MPTEGADNNLLSGSLLDSDESPPFILLNSRASKPVLLVCDHASRRFPRSLGTMGLDPVARRCHLAIDIGAGALTEAVAENIGVTAVLCQYSRLIIDCNRQLMDPGAFLEFGDGVVISGNRNLHATDKKLRENEIYWPYHVAIDAQIERLHVPDTAPVFVAIHSFTPVLNGEPRGIEVGVLWDADRVTAEIFMSEFRRAGYNVGDNEPYSGKAPADFTIDHHAEAKGIPHVGIEIRQDLIDDQAGVDKVGALMSHIIDSIPARLRATDIGARQPKPNYS
jgi:predicted N-formylglutamate amidohydrolase